MRFVRLQSDTLSPFTRCLAFYSGERDGDQYSNGSMWCSRSNPWPSRVVPSSLLAFTFNTQFLHRCISFLSLAKQCSVSNKIVATALTFLDFNIDAHDSARQEVTPDPNVHRPRSHIVNQMAVHVLQGCQFFFLWWATQCFPGMVACVLYN